MSALRFSVITIVVLGALVATVGRGPWSSPASAQTSINLTTTGDGILWGPGYCTTGTPSTCFPNERTYTFTLPSPLPGAAVVSATMHLGRVGLYLQIPGPNGERHHELPSSSCTSGMTAAQFGLRINSTLTHNLAGIATSIAAPNGPGGSTQPPPYDVDITSVVRASLGGPPGASTFALQLTLISPCNLATFLFERPSIDITTTPPPSCSVPDLTPLPMLAAHYSENLDLVKKFDDTSGATPESISMLNTSLKTKVDSFIAKVKQEFGRTLTIGSGYRPTAYQAHLYEVYTRKLALDALPGIVWDASQRRLIVVSSTTDAVACSQRIAKINAELMQHKNFKGVASPGNSLHEVGGAVDLSPRASIEAMAAEDSVKLEKLISEAGLVRPCMSSPKEPWHFTEVPICQFTFEVDVYSPVAVLVTDPLGRRVGTDLVTRATINEIGAAAVFSGGDSHPTVISISPAIPGTYVVTAVAVASGPYEIQIAAFSDGPDSTSETQPEGVRTINGMASPGQTIAPVSYAVGGGADPPSSPTCAGRRPTITAMPGVPTQGTAGPDVILGTSGPDIIRGGTGDDIICGGGGSDHLFGEGGDDTLYGDSGDDALDGGFGDDTLHGGDGTDMLTGGGGNDTLLGDAGGDTLSGNEGNDRLNGGPGNDTLTGGPGNDTLTDREGSQQRFDGGTGTDSCIGTGTAAPMQVLGCEVNTPT